MLIRGVGMGAPGFVTSCWRGLSGFLQDGAIVLLGLQWEDLEKNHNVDQRMESKTWEQRLNSSGMIFAWRRESWIGRGQVGHNGGRAIMV
jgi:hypothetical protein